MNKNSFNKFFFLLIVFFFFNNQSQSEIVSPSIKNINHFFSVDAQLNFHLFADSNDERIVWYVSRFGGIGFDEHKPLFEIEDYVIEDGIFSGHTGVRFEGKFSTGGIYRDIASFINEARSKGFIPQAVVARNAETSFILTGFEISADQDLTTQCELVESSFGFSMPRCEAMDINGNWQPVDFLLNFEAQSPTTGLTDSQFVEFSGETLPNWRPTIDNLLYSGANWSSLIQGVVDWEIGSLTQDSIAKIVIDWRKLYEWLFYYMSSYQWHIPSWSLYSVIDQAISSSGAFDILYRLEDGGLSSSPVSQLQKNQVKYKIVSKVMKTLFYTVKGSGEGIPDLANSFIDDVVNIDEMLIGRSEYYQNFSIQVLPNYGFYFFLRANMNKLLSNPVEEWDVYQVINTIERASTLMTIECLTGGFEQQVSVFSDAYCERFLGPVAKFTKNYFSVPQGSSVSFDASSSYIPANHGFIEYNWYFDNTNEYFSTSNDYFTRQYTQEGSFKAFMFIDDGVSPTRNEVAEIFVYDPVKVIVPVLSVLLH